MYTLVSSTNKTVRQKVNLVKQLLVVKMYTLVSSTYKTVRQKVNLIKQLLVVRCTCILLWYGSGVVNMVWERGHGGPPIKLNTTQLKYC
jgi:TRAP-type C4-dicarboxylate transport system permease small subunit